MRQLQSESNRTTSPEVGSRRSERGETTPPYRTPGWLPIWTRSTPTRTPHPGKLHPTRGPTLSCYHSKTFYIERWMCVCVCPVRRVRPPSPLSALALQRLRPPSSAAWAEFLNASANGKMERDFALLTLTDGEQRELYEAARIIQNAFRRYKVSTPCTQSLLPACTTHRPVLVRCFQSTLTLICVGRVGG